MALSLVLVKTSRNLFKSIIDFCNKLFVLAIIANFDFVNAILEVLWQFLQIQGLRFAVFANKMEMSKFFAEINNLERTLARRY